MVSLALRPLPKNTIPQLGNGSSSAIFACSEARLGLRSAFTGMCGGDTFEHCRCIQGRSLDVTHTFYLVGNRVANF